MKTRARTLLGALGVAGAALAVVPGAGAAEYYAGKTITVLVGFSAGGGNDTAARVLSKHLARFVPGSPDIVVKNMPGAGSLKAHNFLYERAKPDGETIMWSAVQFMAQVIGAPGVRFDYANSVWVGGALGAPFMMFARTDIAPGGLKTSSDFLKAKDIRFAGIRPTVALDMYGRPTLDLLGLPYTYIPGYRGAAKIRIAIRSGEANTAVHNLIGWRSGVEGTMGAEGIVKPLWYYPLKDEDGNFVRSELIDDMPSFIDFYRQQYGKDPSGPMWNAFKLILDLRGTVSNGFFGPPNMSPEAATALRGAFDKMMRDPEAIAEQKKVFGFNYTPVSYKVAERVSKGLGKTDPALVAFWKKYLAEGAEAVKN